MGTDLFHSLSSLVIAIGIIEVIFLMIRLSPRLRHCEEP